MKKLLFVIAAAIGCFCISCNSNAPVTAETKGPTTAEKNIAAMHAINKAIETGDVSKLDDYITADAIDHTDKGITKGIDTIKAMFVKMHATAGDMKMEVVKELADSEYVFQWIRVSGTATTSDMGMPAGTKYDMTAIEVAKFKDGKSNEHWEFMQPADMMKMMPPPPMPKAKGK